LKHARPLPPALIALSPGDLEPARVPAFLLALRRALAAGLPGVLVRERGLCEREYAEVFGAVVEAAEGTAAWVAAHDRAHVALICGGRAVHLSFRSLVPRDARRVVGAETTLGLSTHAADATEEWAGADYLFHGPVHATPSKVGLQEPIGVAGIARAVERAQLPVYAIGGLRPEDVAPLRDAGAAGIAVLGGIFGQRDPAAATGRYLRAIEAGVA